VDAAEFLLLVISVQLDFSLMHSGSLLLDFVDLICDKPCSLGLRTATDPRAPKSKSVNVLDCGDTQTCILESQLGLGLLRKVIKQRLTAYFRIHRKVGGIHTLKCVENIRAPDNPSLGKDHSCNGQIWSGSEHGTFSR
jgi:hypothetical protein